MTTASSEVALIDRLARALPRSPRQLNALHASDAELVHLHGTTVLAVTTDGIVEEIAAGLYDDPALVGWMSVAVNASDLAAVGAQPLGIVLCETIPPTMGPDDIGALQRGIAEAAVAHGLPVLGGDTNAGAQLQAVGTAVGLVEGAAPLTRLGAAPGDHLYASGPLGLGSAFAFTQLARRAPSSLAPHPTSPFRPLARLREGDMLRHYASACMDTSDGLLATLDELGRLNGVGFRLTLPVNGMLHGAAAQLAAAQHLPPWTMLAGPHGEFELVFTVPPARTEALRSAAASDGWTPIRLGDVVPGTGATLGSEDGEVVLDTGKVRNLFLECEGDPGRYIQALAAMDAPAVR
jgi:thiamine-monophosphate kinase